MAELLSKRFSICDLIKFAESEFAPLDLRELSRPSASSNKITQSSCTAVSNKSDKFFSVLPCKLSIKLE